MSELVDDWVCKNCGEKVNELERTGSKCPKCGHILNRRVVLR